MPKSDDELHGTHVAGIIAQSNNNLGMDGVSSTAKIMCLRAVPNEGDEYDKDVASLSDMPLTMVPNYQHEFWERFSPTVTKSGSRCVCRPRGLTGQCCWK